MSKAAIIFGIGVVMGLAAASAKAARPARGEPLARNVLMSVPNLTADQRSRITHLLGTTKIQTAPVRQQIAGIRRDLARLWSADQPDQTAIAVKRGELEGSMAKVHAIWNEFFAQLHDVLTSSQRNWLASHAPGLHGSDPGRELGEGATDCSCGEPPRAQHPGPLQEQ